MVLDSLVVIVVSDNRNNLCCSSLYLFYLLWFLITGIISVSHICIFSILSMPRLNCGDQNCTACSRCGHTIGDFHNGMISSLFLYLKLRAMNPSAMLSVFQLLSVCFCHLKCLVMMIPRSRCSSVVF